MLSSHMADAQPFGTLVHQRHDPVVRRKKNMLLIGDKNRPALRSDSLIDDDDVQRVGREIRRRMSDSQRPIEHIEGIHGVGYVYDLGVRVDAKADTLHLADEAVL